eukprot:s1675_g17.t1
MNTMRSVLRRTVVFVWSPLSLGLFWVLSCGDVFSSLEELSLDGEMLEAPVLALLPKRCPRLRSLLVSFAAELDGEALGALTTLGQLDALTLKKAQKPPDDAWASFFLQQQRCRAADADPGWRILNFCECELFCDGAANTLALVPQVRLVEQVAAPSSGNALRSCATERYMAEQRVEGPTTSELRLLRCGLRGLADVPQLRAPEGQRLRLLHLHGNALATLRGLDAVCPLLEELTLSSNDLQDLEGLQNLQKLRFLDLSCNCLSSLQGLEALCQLQELRAAYNQISQLAELSFFAKPSQLRLLDLRDNSITHLGQLLFLGGFPLEDLRFQSAGGRRSNPMCRLPGYRTTVLRTAPELRYLDEEMLGSRERDELPPAPMALPEDWPPRPKQRADASQAALLEAKQQLLVLQEERQGYLQAVAESRAAGASAQESLASAVPDSRKAVPKISQQVQQELKLVAAEAKRRQAMNRELKGKLSQTLQQLQQTKESERSLRVKIQQLRGRNQLAFLEQQEASVEAQSFQAAFGLAQSQREEAAAQRSQEILEADLFLAETEEETQALASAKMELHQRQHRQLILKDQLQRLREDSRSWREEMPLAEGKLRRGRSRCLAEAAAGEAAMQGSEEAGQLLAQNLKVKALAAEELCRERREAEEEIRVLTLRGEERR